MIIHLPAATAWVTLAVVVVALSLGLAVAGAAKATLSAMVCDIITLYEAYIKHTVTENNEE